MTKMIVNLGSRLGGVCVGERAMTEDTGERTGGDHDLWLSFY